jgi:hypothetical protein
VTALFVAMEDAELKWENLRAYLAYQYDFAYCSYPYECQSDLISTLANMKESLSFEPLLLLHAMHKKYVRSVFLFCKRMEVSDHVRYLTIEMVGQFYRQHLIKVKKCLTAEYGPDDEEQTQLAIGRMIRQMPLRAFTCILIARKMLEQPIQASYVDDMLRYLGLKYTKETVFKSELRIMTEMSFKLPTRSFHDCLEMLLYLVGLKLEIQPFLFFPYMYDMLDLAYLNFDRVIADVYSIIAALNLYNSSGPFLLVCAIAAVCATGGEYDPNEQVRLDDCPSIIIMLVRFRKF